MNYRSTSYYLDKVGKATWVGYFKGFFMGFLYGAMIEGMVIVVLNILNIKI
jgi:hypothetical protein